MKSTGETYHRSFVTFQQSVVCYTLRTGDTYKTGRWDEQIPVISLCITGMYFSSISTTIAVIRTTTPVICTTIQRTKIENDCDT
jgi:hypothetical protein